LKELQDDEIISKILGGDSRAFSVIVDRYKDTIYSIIVNMTADSNMAEEIAQETFIRLYRFLDKYKGQSSLKTFVTRIAINLSLNALKKRKIKRQRNIGIEDMVHDVAGPQTNLDDQMLIQRAMKLLDDEQRSIVSMRMIEGYSTKETAIILGIKEGTVMSRLSRTMKKLKEILKELGYEK